MLVLFAVLQSGKAFTAKGLQVLELVGKETVDLLISETGIEVEKNKEEGDQQTDEDQLFEEVTFDRCFYIYGGPEQLEVGVFSFQPNIFCLLLYILIDWSSSGMYIQLQNYLLFRK